MLSEYKILQILKGDWNAKGPTINHLEGLEQITTKMVPRRLRKNLFRECQKKCWWSQCTNGGFLKNLGPWQSKPRSTRWLLVESLYSIDRNGIQLGIHSPVFPFKESFSWNLSPSTGEYNASQWSHWAHIEDTLVGNTELNRGLLTHVKCHHSITYIHLHKYISLSHSTMRLLGDIVDHQYCRQPRDGMKFTIWCLGEPIYNWNYPRGSRSASKVCTQKTLPATWSVLLIYTLRLRSVVRGVVRLTRSSGVLEGYHTSSVVYTSARSGILMGSKID